MDRPVGVSTICEKLFLKILFIYFLERRGEREREKHQRVLPLMRPPLGTWPATQARALTGNRTGDPLVHRLVLNR